MIHHQSQGFNFSSALRQESTVAFIGWIFYLPMAVDGVPPEQLSIGGLIALLYQFWIHTEHIGKLGWFDRVFSSLSNHRVNRAVNDQYSAKTTAARSLSGTSCLAPSPKKKKPASTAPAPR